MALDFEELLAKKRPTVVECRIALDADLAEAHATALTEHDVAERVATDNPDQRSAQDALAAAQEALSAAEDAMEGTTAVFRFQGLGRAEWDALVEEHPATREQKEKARKESASPPVWNDDTFGPALVAACSVDPVITYEQAAMLWKSDKWNFAELKDLFGAAFSASRGRRVPQLGKGFGRTQS